MNRVDLLEKTINYMYILKQLVDSLNGVRNAHHISDVIGELERMRDDYMVLEERVRNKNKEVKDGER